MIVFRHADSRFPFLWETADQPAARWHDSGEGPVHYFSETPDGAWSEFLRHEEIVDPADLAGIDRSLWSIDLPTNAPQPTAPAGRDTDRWGDELPGLPARGAPNPVDGWARSRCPVRRPRVALAERVSDGRGPPAWSVKGRTRLRHLWRAAGSRRLGRMSKWTTPSRPPRSSPPARRIAARTTSGTRAQWRAPLLSSRPASRARRSVPRRRRSASSARRRPATWRRRRGSPRR